MSKADEMFDELGYKKHNEFIFIKIKDRGITIEFNENTKTFIKMEYAQPGELTMQELQAINAKCKELGWLDE